jgi:hypothetical protein
MPYTDPKSALAGGIDASLGSLRARNPAGTPDTPAGVKISLLRYTRGEDDA